MGNIDGGAEELAESIADGTAGNGEDQGGGDPGLENGEGAGEERSDADGTEDKPGAEDKSKDESKEEGEAEEESDEDKDQAAGDEDVVAKATESLEKALGKKLDDKEALQELCKSHLNSETKIQDYAAQIKQLVPYVEAYERACQIIEEYQKAAEEGGETDKDGKPVKPKVDPEIRRELDQLKGERAQERAREMKTRYATAYDGLEKNEAIGGKEFADLRKEYMQRLGVNKYAPMPDKLARFTSLVVAATEMGVETDKAVKDAWKAVNADNLEKQFKLNLAKAQQKKIGKGGITAGKGGKAPADMRGKSVSEIVGSIVDGALTKG
jgi:hypothetical protein